MNLRTRRLNRLVIAATAVLAVAAGTFATVYAVDNSGSHLGHRAPTKAEAQELVTARQQTGTECHLEWDGVQADQYEAICQPPAACASVNSATKVACVALYGRPAVTTRNADGSVISDPAGPALVAECLSQYQGVELNVCLSQPAN